MTRNELAASLLVASALIACDLGDSGLAINEVMASNDGAWLDEWGEDDDYIEVINTTGRPIDLGDYVLTDGSGKRARLPEVELGAGEVLVLSADASPEQGPSHLPFKLSAGGDTLVLGRAHGFAVERVEVPPLGINATLQRFPNGRGSLRVCEHPTPGRANGDACAASAQSGASNRRAD